MIITYQATLLHKELVAPHIYFLKFTYPADASWDFKSGQYMIFHVPQGDGHPVRRLYSIASSSLQKDTLDFVIEMVPNGIGSAYIEAMKVGDIATLQGAAGLFTYKPSGRKPVFFATGTGIAPIYSMIYEMLNSPQTSNEAPILFWGMKTCQDLYLVPELTKLAKEHDIFYFRTCLSREEDASTIREDVKEYALLGRVTHGVEELTVKEKTTLNDYDYYLCGSKHVVESLREYLAEKGVPKDQVHFEKFT